MFQETSFINLCENLKETKKEWQYILKTKFAVGNKTYKKLILALKHLYLKKVFGLAMKQIFGTEKSSTAKHKLIVFFFMKKIRLQSNNT